MGSRPTTSTSCCACAAWTTARGVGPGRCPACSAGPFSRDCSASGRFPSVARAGVPTSRPRSWSSLTARRLGLGSRAALLAGVAMAASAAAYTSTHWASGLGRLMASDVRGGALFAHLQARLTTSPVPRWVAGACAVGAVFSEGIRRAVAGGVLRVRSLGLSARAWPGRAPRGRAARRRERRLRLRTVADLASSGGRGLRAFGVACALAREPCSRTARGWCGSGIRSGIAARPFSRACFGWGAVVFAAWTLLAFRERAERARPITTGLAEFLLMIAPVIPLAQHSFISITC